MLKDGIGFSRVIVCCGRVDLRKGIPGLTAYVRLNYGLNTTEKGTLFLFCGNRSDRIKGIVFEGDEGDGKIVDSVRPQSPDVLQFACGHCSEIFRRSIMTGCYCLIIIQL